MTLSGATVLIHGGTGFVGSHLTRRLTALGARVHFLMRPESSVERVADVRPAPDSTRVEPGDVAALRACIRSVRPDVAFLAAAVTSDRGRGVPPAEAGTGESYQVNVMGTLQLLHAIADEVPTARVIRLGSIAEYGLGPLPFSEDQRERPVAPYGASLVAATHLGQALYRQAGLAVTTLRLALTYGPSQAENFLVPSLIGAGLDGRPFDLLTPSDTRDLVYVDDVIDALIAAVTAGGLAGEVVNIGSGREYEIGDLAALIVGLTGGRTTLRTPPTPAAAVEKQRLVCDPARARRLLGWEATTTIERGLERTVAWYRTHRPS
jgi:nucleoside-diphosphate-sugar epimerase